MSERDEQRECQQPIEQPDDSIHETQREERSPPAAHIKELESRLADEIGRRRRAEQSARAFIDSALDAVITIDAFGRIRQWNAQAESLLGWSREDALGKDMAALVMPPRYHAAYRLGLERFLESGQRKIMGRQLDVTALKSDGSEIPVQLRVAARQMDDATLFHAFIRSVAQPHEDAEYRAHMAALVDSSYDAIIGKDIHGRIISWNAGAEHVYGYREAEAVGRTIDIILPDNVDQEEPELLHALETGQRLEQFDTLRRRKDGRLVSVSVTISPIADENGSIIGSSTIERDVTERKRAEIAEAQHKRLLALRGDINTALAANQNPQSALRQCVRALMRHPDIAFAGIWTLDEEATSPRLQASAGGGEGETNQNTLRCWEQVIRGIARDRQPQVNNCVAGDPGFRCQDWVKSEGVVAFAGLPLLSGQRPLGVLSLFSRKPLSEQVVSQLAPLADGISQFLQRQEKETELRAAKEAAELAAQTRADFLSNVSHELRTPMNAILGMTQLALSEELSEEIRDYLTTAHDSAHLLLKLLNDILDFSKLESGKFSVESGPFRLREMLDETLKPLSSRAFEKGLELAGDVAADAPDQLIGDEMRLRQVLTNLISNAVKFTEQGEVIARVETLQRWPRETRLRFTVCDTGVGISPQDQRRILEPFTQLDPSSTRRYSGTGLGLAICGELLQLMGSHLVIKSEPGRGSCFSFEIALKTPQQPADKNGITSPLDRLTQMPVLIVDDNRTSRRILCQMLFNSSMKPKAVPAGKQALAELQRARQAHAPYGLVIVDACMPQMDGYSLARQIRHSSGNPPPVILMAAPADRHRLHAPEAADHVTAVLHKPVSESDLLDAVMTAKQVGVEDSDVDDCRSLDSTSPTELTVLVAEDTPANQKVVTAVLGKRGHKVVVAQNGREAVELCSKHQFDAILMDLQMPVMDGFQATATIQRLEQDRDRRTPIIALTAHAMRGDREKCFAAGMQAYIAKPIDVRELVNKVESIAGRRQDPQISPPQPSFVPHSQPTDRTMNHSSQPHSLTANQVEPAVVDLAGSLERLGGDLSLLREFIGYFEEDAPKLLGELRGAIQRGDAPAAQRAAHSLKGLAANFGAADCVSAASEMETLAKTSDLTAAADPMKSLEKEVARLKNALGELKA